VPPAGIVGVGVVRTTPTSAQITLMFTGPDELFAGLVSTVAVTMAVSVSSGQLLMEVVADTLTVRLWPSGTVPKLQLSAFPPVTVHDPAFGPLGTHVRPAGSVSVMMTPFDAPGPLAVTTMV